MALNYYNKANFLKSDDSFLNDLISKALSDINAFCSTDDLFV